MDIQATTRCLARFMCPLPISDHHMNAKFKMFLFLSLKSVECSLLASSSRGSQEVVKTELMAMRVQHSGRNDLLLTLKQKPRSRFILDVFGSCRRRPLQVLNLPLNAAVRALEGEDWVISLGCSLNMFHKRSWKTDTISSNKREEHV